MYFVQSLSNYAVTVPPNVWLVRNLFVRSFFVCEFECDSECICFNN